MGGAWEGNPTSTAVQLTDHPPFFFIFWGFRVLMDHRFDVRVRTPTNVLPCRSGHLFWSSGT
jgi:hypothetical protein